MTIFGERLDGTRFETRHPIYKRDESVDSAIEEHGVITVFESVEQPSLWSQLLVGAFPDSIALRHILLFYATNARWHVWKGWANGIWQEQSQINGRRKSYYYF